MFILTDIVLLPEGKSIIRGDKAIINLDSESPNHIIINKKYYNATFLRFKLSCIEDYYELLCVPCSFISILSCGNIANLVVRGRKLIVNFRS